MCRRYEIDLSARTQHGALLDAELLSDVYVYLELMGGRQSALLLDDDSGQELAEKVNVDFAMRSFPPSEGELEAHEKFMAQIKNSN